MGSLGISVLSEFAESSNRMLSWHARWYLAELKNANPIEEFKDFIESQNYELESGWLLISRVAYPDLDIGKILSELDLIAARCKELLIHPSSSREVCRIINRVLFHEFGFRGNIENYANPDNSHLNRVIETRRGLPIALSMLYLLVGQRLGANLEPIGVPGHFMVGSFDEDLPFYIDAFERGRILSAEQMLERLEEPPHRYAKPFREHAETSLVTTTMPANCTWPICTKTSWKTSKRPIAAAYNPNVFDEFSRSSP